MFHWAKWALVAAIIAATAGVKAHTVKAVGTTTITDAQLKAYIDAMTEDEQIGQLFISRTPKSPDQARADVAKYHLGGLVLFGQDFQAGTAEQLKQTVQSYQAQAKVPLLVATDQEGGTVSRLSDSPSYTNSTFPSPQQAYAAGGMSSVLYQAKLAAQDLHYLGVNWNFAPIADVAADANNYIYDRTIGLDYQGTADYIKQVVPAIQSQGVAATLKHFPGYGAAGDTHTGFATINTPYAELAQKDLLPFKAGIDAGVDGIMVTHILMHAIDDTYPASLSHKVITGVLREKLGYKGVIITDGLGMGAIAAFKAAHHIDSIDVLALQAGNDALLADDYTTGIAAIKAALSKQTLTQAQIKAADLHVLQLKNKLGLLDAANFIKASLTVEKPTLTAKTATLTGAVTAPSVAAGTKLVADVAGKRVGAATLTQDGKFTLQLPRTTKAQTVTLTVANTKLTKTVTIAAHKVKAPKKAVSAATTTHRVVWPWLVGLGVVIVGLFAIVLSRRKLR